MNEIKIQELKNEIIELVNGRQYMKCLQQCFKLLKLLDKKDNYSFRYLFFCYRTISTIYSVLEQFNLALKFIKKAKIYIELYTDEVLYHWTVSYYYYKLNKYDLALKHINYAIDICANKLENTKWLYGALVHKALLTNDEKLMLEAIQKSIDLNVEQYRIDEYYQDLFELYLNNKKYQKAFDTLRYIKSTTLRMKLYQRMHQLNELL